MRRTIASAVFLTLLSLSTRATAQGYVDQQAIKTLQATQGNVPDVAPVSWHAYKPSAKLKTNKAVVADIQRHLDSLPGELREGRMQVVELSNRVCAKYLLQRGVVLVPDSFPPDFRAYAPYPQHYAGADTFGQLFVADKYTQTFAAYEGGRLVRWGLISTGRDDGNTPTGRYTFNWRDEFRLSTAAPPGEVWELRWVYNFHGPRGIHVHQYAVPIAQPASHGCVRLTEADARWNYDWAAKGTTVLVLNHNPLGLAAHWSSGPQPQSLIGLPPSPLDIPDGLTNDNDAVAGR